MRNRSVFISLLALPVAAIVHVAAASAAGQDKLTEVLHAAREAVGASTLQSVQAISATGGYRRTFGEREISGDTTIEILLPDKLKRTDEMGIPGGPRMERISVLNGNVVWDDSVNRGGGGGFMMRMGPGGGAPGAEPSEADKERFRQMQVRRMKGDLTRYVLAWLLQSDAPMTYVGIAEAEDGKADVVEVKPEGGVAVRLFIDQNTHTPLMMTYEGAAPRVMMNRGGQRPTPEEIEKIRNEPPKMVTYEVRFADYKKVDGLLLPHQITQGFDGTVNEEWTIEKFKINPPLKAEAFEKKGS
jgi:hypothetical protein